MFKKRNPGNCLVSNCSCVCTATLTVTATNCAGGAAISGASVSASMTGQSTVTGTTNGSGVAVLTVPAAGTWAVQASKSAFTTASTTAAATCGANTNVSLCLTATTACSPCDIPHVNLSLTWTYLNSSGGTTNRPVTVGYNSTTNTWSSGTIGNPADYPSGTSPCIDGGGFVQSHLFVVGCSSGVFGLSHQFTCVGSLGTSAFYPLSTATYSCSPLSGDWAAAALSYRDRRFILTQ